MEFHRNPFKDWSSLDCRQKDQIQRSFWFWETSVGNPRKIVWRRLSTLGLGAGVATRNSKTKDIQMCPSISKLRYGCMEFKKEKELTKRNCGSQ